MSMHAHYGPATEESLAIGMLFRGILALVEQIEAKAHGGEACPHCRTNAIASLAYGLGFPVDSPESLEAFNEALQIIDARDKQRNAKRAEDTLRN